MSNMLIVRRTGAGANDWPIWVCGCSLLSNFSDVLNEVSAMATVEMCFQRNVQRWNSPSTSTR